MVSPQEAPGDRPQRQLEDAVAARPVGTNTTASPTSRETPASPDPGDHGEKARTAHHEHDDRSPRIGLIGRYPPTRYGIATFTASLAKAIGAVRPTCFVGVAACVDEHAPTIRSSEVVAELVGDSPASRRAAVEALKGFDVAVLRHESGIYGGRAAGFALDDEGLARRRGGVRRPALRAA